MSLEPLSSRKAAPPTLPPPPPETANVWLLFGSCVFVLVGLVGPLICSMEIRRASLCKSQPDELLCETLANYGPTQNRYVTLIDGFPCPFSIEAVSDDAPWRFVSVPLGPRAPGSDFADPARIHVILTSSQISNMKQLEDELQDGRVTGMLGDRIEWRDSVIEAGNPGIDLKKCWALHHNETPSQPGSWYVGWLVMGFVGAAGAAGLHYSTRKPLPWEALVMFAVTGPAIWLLIGLGVVTRGRKWLPITVLAPLFLLSATACILVGAVLFQQNMLAEDWSRRGTGAFLTGLGSVLMGYGAYFMTRLLLEQPSESPTNELTAVAMGNEAAAAPTSAVDAPVPLSQIGKYVCLVAIGPIGFVAFKLITEPGELQPTVVMWTLGISIPLAMLGAWLWLTPDKPTA